MLNFLEWAFQGIGTEALSFLAGGISGWAISRVRIKQKTNNVQKQRAGHSSNQTMIAGQIRHTIDSKQPTKSPENTDEKK